MQTNYRNRNKPFPLYAIIAGMTSLGIHLKAVNKAIKLI